jgi:hypothetical protein
MSKHCPKMGNDTMATFWLHTYPVFRQPPRTNRLDVSCARPLRSPDLTPLDTFQLGYIKNTVHQQKKWDL